jgi:CBS domain-containing protein
MPIGEVCVRDVVVTGRETTVREAAKLMAQHHMGNLVVVREEAGGRVRGIRSAARARRWR